MNNTLKQIFKQFTFFLLQMGAYTLIFTLAPSIFSILTHYLKINSPELEFIFRIALILCAIYIFLSERINFLILLNKTMIQGIMSGDRNESHHMKQQFPVYFYVAIYLLEKENPNLNISKIDDKRQFYTFKKEVESLNLNETNIKNILNIQKLKKFV